jgi:hypothetical protein
MVLHLHLKPELIIDKDVAVKPLVHCATTILKSYLNWITETFGVLSVLFIGCSVSP